MKTKKNTTLSELFQKIQMENRVNRYKIHTPNTHNDNCSISWLAVDTSKESDRVKLVYGTKHPLLVTEEYFISYSVTIKIFCIFLYLSR